MNPNQISYPQKDRWSFVWLVVGTLLSLLWRVPLVYWLVPVFYLRFTRTQSTRRGFFLIWLASFLTVVPPLYPILSAMIPSPLPVFIITAVITALLASGIPYLVDRLLVPRLKGFSATLVFPLIMTVMDYISAKSNPLGSLAGSAYNQYSNLALIQLLSVTGMWGIVFLVNWLGPVLNYAWERGFEWKAIRRNMVAYAAIMLGVFLFGGVRLAYAPQAENTVRIHGFTAVDVRHELMPKMHALAGDRQAYRQASTEVQELYLEGTLREAQAGAQIVHWPEMAIFLPEEDEADFLSRVAQIASDEGIYVVVPYALEFKDGGPFDNKLLIIDPAGEVVLEHHKYGGATLDGAIPGDGILRTVDTPYGTLSGIICNDTNHEEVVLQAGKNGTDILFSPSMEHKPIDPIHADMAMYRAIENGVTLVRQADNGLSIAVDPYGRISGSMDHFNNTERVFVAKVPILSTFTFYPYVGDLFAWLAIAGLVGITLTAFVQGRREKRLTAAVANS